jgi:hypothetical protein
VVLGVVLYLCGGLVSDNTSCDWPCTMSHIARSSSMAAIRVPKNKCAVVITPLPRGPSLCASCSLYRTARPPQFTVCLRGTLVACVLDFPWSLVHTGLLERASHLSSQPPPGQVGASHCAPSKRPIFLGKQKARPSKPQRPQRQSLELIVIVQGTHIAPS